MRRIEKYELSYKTEEEFEWKKWSQEIPYISFPSEWEIKIVPPFANAIIRFLVKNGNDCISVYLDCYDLLGCFGAPYWEVYPYPHQESDTGHWYLDTARCAMSDTDGLIKNIQTTLDFDRSKLNANTK